MGVKARIFAVCLTALCPLALRAQALPDCVHAEASVLLFPGSRAAQDLFYDKLDTLVATGRGNVNVWHIGGSHVQAAYFPNRIMNGIDSLTLRGDRGFLFPLKLAGTNYDKTYRISTTGEWEAPILTRNSDLRRPRYGVTGYGARTASPDASVGFRLNADGSARWSCESVRVLGYGSSDRAYPYILCLADTLRFEFEAATHSYLFDLPAPTDSVVVRFHVPAGEEFTLNGLQPLSWRPGVNYFASGVNGAALPSWLDKCEDLERDLQLVHPDLAILAVGINDSATSVKNFKPEKFKENYRRLIEMVRRISPECAFIFVTNNDSYRYVRRGMSWNGNGEAVRQAMLELAREYGAGVWDLYGVMGGAHTVEKWRDAGLAKNDRLHFTDEGYNLLGDLFVEALMADKLNR
jgi:lysophospholipase L1-like esterase